MNEPIDAINWVRWLVYFLGGVPFLAWLIFTQDRVMRLIAVLGFLFFLQDNIVGRRYVIGGTSVAPSTVLAYVGLIAEVMAQRRLPNLGAYLPLWLGFIFFAATNIVVGSLGTGLWGVNFKQFQIFYLEGILIFAYGVMALRSDQDLLRFTRWLMVIGLGVAVVHVLTIATGFRFRNAIEQYSSLYYAGVLDNTNSLGSLYAMWVPVGLSLAVGPRQPRLWRFVTLAALVGMFGSLILSGSRGGILFTVLTSILALGASRIGVRRAVVATAVAGVGVAAGYAVLQFAAPDALREILGIAKEEGAKTTRFALFAGYLRVLADHPFGIGLSPANFDAMVNRYGIPAFVSAHNIYLDIALQSGVFGLATFLAISFSTLIQNRRAASTTMDSRQKEGLVYLFLPLVGFLGVGFFEPIYTISNKLNTLYWISVGVSVGASQRILAARRAAAWAAADHGSPSYTDPVQLRQS